MDAKEYLKQLEELHEQILQQTEEIDALKELAVKTGAYSEYERVQASTNGDAIPKIVAMYLDMEKDKQMDIAKYISLRKQIRGEIKTVKNKLHRNILYKRYVKFKKLELIAVETGYSYQHIKNQHGYALLSFQKIINENKVLKST